MIRDAIVHIVGDQPMLCDLDQMPESSDASLVCTNLRTVDGKKPIFIDYSDSWFVLPLQFVRFVEIPRRSVVAADLPADSGESGSAPGRAAAGEPVAPARGGPTPSAPVAMEPAETEDLEPDMDLLRRIREV